MEMALKVAKYQTFVQFDPYVQKKKFLGLKKNDLRWGWLVKRITPSKLPFGRRVGPPNYHANIQAGS